MMLCRKCGHIQIGYTDFDPTLSPTNTHFFGSDEINLEAAWEKMDNVWGSCRKPAFLRILDTLHRMGFKQGSLLDVGSGFGHFMFLAKQRGFSPLGVEPSLQARRIANEKFSLESVEHLDCISEMTNFFDVVFCAETLYYLTDVRDSLEKLRKVLKPNGVFVLKLKSNRTYLFRAAAFINRILRRFLCVRPGSFLYGPSLVAKHLFTTRSACLLCRETGFRILKVVNEKHTHPLSLDFRSFVKVCYSTFAALVTIVTFGKVKIGTEITIYAASDAE
jgi:2-polyprenyl-3-methyl-5-hydroxy-6-metoxy-1,4-benzoquinol methylase